MLKVFVFEQMFEKKLGSIANSHPSILIVDAAEKSINSIVPNLKYSMIFMYTVY